MRMSILRIRNKRLKGNVSLLVILILLASSVIALLSISQIQHLITYWNMTFNYFRAFYLAKAWTELGLTEVYNRENWFEDKIENEIKEDGSIEFDEMIAKNFLWDNDEYAWAKPYFNMEIKSRYDRLTNDIRSEDCKDNLIELEKWEWIVLPLFKDNTSGLKNILIPGWWVIKPYKNILSFDNLNWGDITLWWFSYNGDVMSYITVKNSKNLDLYQFMQDLWKNNTFESSKKQYLTIKNSGSDTIKFCIKNSYGSDKFIPYSDYLITTRGNYGDIEVWLQSVVKKSTPSWALNVLGL